ncbi:hypothetical protein [Modicisalibacter luteus]|uniref:Uncharacterized protein n=1 Tax=Modicisalibacter luteus TaxID=453962 RepID=A0ABV7M4S8_9GAMM|nr:hypothetical protein [Halomonas lutea]GHA88438.1 hypothetical protein GCM10007159_07310 [Halomonas lutea]
MSPMAHPTSETSILSTTRHRDTGHEPLNRLVGEHLDRLLMHYARHDDAFTVCELRDQLLKEPELEQACPETLRLRVRDRVRTLNHQGLAHQVGTQGKRRPVFKLDLGDADADVATTEPAEIPLPSSAESSEDAEAPPLSDASATRFLDYLNRERQRLRMDMQAALGEARHYHQILSQFPEQQARIEPLHHAALERGGELKGALDAVITLYRSVSQEVAP